MTVDRRLEGANGRGALGKAVLAEAGGPVDVARPWLFVGRGTGAEVGTGGGILGEVT